MNRKPLRLDEACPACGRSWRHHAVEWERCRVAIEPCDVWLQDRFASLAKELADVATGLCVNCERPLRKHFEFQSAVVVVNPGAANGEDGCRENLIRCRAEIEVRLPFLFVDCRRK